MATGLSDLDTFEINLVTEQNTGICIYDSTIKCEGAILQSINYCIRQARGGDCEKQKMSDKSLEELQPEDSEKVRARSLLASA